VVETCCDRCGETTISGLPDRDSLLDAVAWARDHKCPPSRPDTRAGADRPGRPGAEDTAPGKRPPAAPVPRARLRVGVLQAAAWSCDRRQVWALPC